MADDKSPSVESLLEEARLTAAMPSPEERLRLRTAAKLSRTQVAQACGVGRQTVANWEAGTSEPAPPARLAYLRLLEGLAQLHPAPAEAPEAPAAPVPAAAVAPVFAEAYSAFGPDGLVVQGEMAPCLRCGAPTPYKATDGRSLHPGGFCPAPAATPVSASPPAAAPATEPAAGAPAAAVPAPTTSASSAPAPGPDSSPAALAARNAQRHQSQRRARSAARAQADTEQLIVRAVRTELDKAEGDADAATAALIKRAIPDVMALFDETRVNARYDYTAYPALPDILHKPKKGDPDLIWEARPNWRHPDHRRHPDGPLHVTALDVNAAYLSAMKTWLPIGKLEHSTDGTHDRKRAGVHLITPPPWDHRDLPNPLGDRDEPGPLWVTESTLRLLLRLAGPKYRLLDEPPHIHESWTSGATENFLDALRVLLAGARTKAIEAGDDVTEAYVKAMYAKFVSTLGESVHNREIMRPDWMHLVRSQAFANLWNRAYKAHQAGLTVISVMGTDELHVAGDWRPVFPEGRGLGEVLAPLRAGHRRPPALPDRLRGRLRGHGARGHQRDHPHPVRLARGGALAERGQPPEAGRGVLGPAASQRGRGPQTPPDVPRRHPHRNQPGRPDPGRRPPPAGPGHPTAVRTPPRLGCGGRCLAGRRRRGVGPHLG
ncbi:helix-turn-helix domain-containing protein [Streptomyces rimosus]|uniref:helix-turn-helix domain-containing protein n=2 Tax=Streptomyces rimosus TaxID=1927 RepID=UPI00373AE8AF